MLKTDILVPYLNEIDSIIGKPWTLRVVLELRKVNRIRFCELLESLEGISTSTLSSTLKNLQNNGLVARKSFGRNPPYKVEYSLTRKGFDFLISCYPLLKWIAKNTR